MHTLDLGLFKYMLDFTKELLLEQYESQVIQNFEQRLTLIPRFHSLKIMKNISDITHLTANEMRNIMKIIIFALDNLYNNYKRPVLVISSYIRFTTSSFECIHNLLCRQICLHKF